MWKQTIKIKRNLKIFKEEFEEFLPEKIMDFHIHICPKEAIPSKNYSICGHKQEEYSIKQLKEDCKDMYPERKCYGVCFGHPHIKYDFSKMNEYVSKVCDKKQFFPFRLIKPDEELKVVEKDIIEKKFLGFKPYRNYAENKKEPENVEILDFLPKKFMEIANKYGLIITLHIPKKNRLSDSSNQKQIVYLCEKYPNAKIVLAHVGRAYYLKNIVGNLDKIKKFPNLYFDLAMLNNWEVLEYLFQNVESYKILYGTDIPIALAAGKSVEINDQYTYVTHVPWELSISDEHKKLIFTSFLYEELRAIKKAVERTGLSKKFVEDIFFNNGNKLLNSVKLTHF